MYIVYKYVLAGQFKIPNSTAVQSIFNSVIVQYRFAELLYQGQSFI